ncbi:hypothetical protein B0H67DRAFT_356455 [Lasiosphaeris hirsuta]|uniref:Uncharacterized protein n=1 Tax=Lasiosphaeris hirsuta TaxID=260670 RepID=A0AA40DIF0_9PEZI|nr:hypothetical protein B0H67DRAFT_356455 [Lasiosphaeris hirsuta]
MANCPEVVNRGQSCLTGFPVPPRGGGSETSGEVISVRQTGSLAYGWERVVVLFWLRDAVLGLRESFKSIIVAVMVLWSVWVTLKSNWFANLAAARDRGLVLATGIKVRFQGRLRLPRMWNDPRRSETSIEHAQSPPVSQQAAVEFKSGRTWATDPSLFGKVLGHSAGWRDGSREGVSQCSALSPITSPIQHIPTAHRTHQTH